MDKKKKYPKRKPKYLEVMQSNKWKLIPKNYYPKKSDKPTYTVYEVYAKMNTQD